MNLANRLVIVLGALLVMFAVAVVILFTWAAASESVERLGDFVQFLHDHEEDNGSRIILTLGGAVVALLALAVIIAELTPPRAERVPVRDVRAGTLSSRRAPSPSVSSRRCPLCRTSPRPRRR